MPPLVPCALALPRLLPSRCPNYGFLMSPKIYTLSQKKNKQNYFCYNHVKLPPNLIIFGTKMANSLKLYEVHSLSTSLNSCQCTTVLNADAPKSKLLHNAVVKSPVNFQTSSLAHNKPKYGLFSRIISLYNSSFLNNQNLCSCPVFGSEFSRKTCSSVTFHRS